MMVTGGDGAQERAELKAKIVFSGNWNYRDKSQPSICSKPIGVISIGLSEVVFKHKELFDLLKVYHEADKLSIDMINSEFVNTGVVERAEKPLLDKLQDWINEVKK